jgi:queuosine precursor transporter
MLKNNLEASNTISFGTAIQFRYFFIILTLFSATWLISNIAAVKLVSIFGIILTGGFIIFPLTTMLGNVIVEVYGYKNARQAIWAGFILNLSFVFFINIVNFMPSSPYWKLEEQFNNILIPETRIIFASLVSFLLSDFANSYLMAKMKIKNQGKSLIKRIIISCSASISIDIICFMLLAFSGTMPTFLLIKLMSAAYVKKYLCQIVLLPVIWYLIDRLKAAEGIDIYDYDTKFNPFSIDNVYDLNSIKKSNPQEQVIGFSGLAYETQQ